MFWSPIYYLPMTVAGCSAAISRTMHSLLVLLLPVVLSIPVFASRWDTKGAAEAFESARQKKAEIDQAAAPTLDQYLDCARTYRKVHIKDPHYARTGDAIYEEALVYLEAAERLSRPEYYQNSAAKFRLLLKEYGANRNCRDALLKLGLIYTRHLEDEAAADDVYGRLRSEYGYSEAGIRRIRTAAAGPVRRGSPADSKAEPQAAVPPSQPADSTSHPLSTVRNIRFWTTAEYTRVMIDMDLAAEYKKNHIANPDRVYLDIAKARLSPDLSNRTFALNDDVLKQVRVAQNQPEVVRIVLDASATNITSVSELHDPFRIVIDLGRKGTPAQSSASTREAVVAGAPVNSSPKRQPPPAVTELPASPAPRSAKNVDPVIKPVAKPGVSAAAAKPEQQQSPAVTVATISPPKSDAAAWTAAAADAGAPGKIKEPKTTVATAIPSPAPKADIPIPQPASPTSRGDRTLTRMLGLKVGRIVIDPGHGGHDHGSKGPGGLLEKDLVLALALGLKSMVEEKMGAEVFLTREEDIFIPLEERTAIANRHQADLFISIHANSSRFRSTSGVETYFLDFAKTAAEREIAARENAMADNKVRELEDLVQKIAKADKSSESREFASIVQKKLYAESRRVISSTRNRGVRSAPFIVLIGANMPSILAEVAFISNPRDERLLKKDSTKQALVKALFSGIDGYLKTLGSDLVQNRTSQSQ